MESFRIKPLEWASRSDGSHQEVGRRYEIEPDGKGWRLLRGAGGARNYLGYARDLDTAQAAAQSDHEARLSADLEIDPAFTALRADVTRLTDALAAAEAEAGRLREALTDIAQPFSCGCTPYCRCFEGETGREIVLEIQERAETALSDPAS